MGRVTSVVGATSLGMHATAFALCGLVAERASPSDNQALNSWIELAVRSSTTRLESGVKSGDSRESGEHGASVADRAEAEKSARAIRSTRRDQSNIEPAPARPKRRPTPTARSQRPVASTKVALAADNNSGFAMQAAEGATARHQRAGGTAGGEGSASMRGREGPGAARGPADRRAAVRGWLAQIQRLLRAQAMRRYPRDARADGKQGTVVLALLIDGRGKVADVDLGRSSGVYSLDRAALRTALAFRNLPAPPAVFGASPRTIKIPVRYSLQR